MLNKLWAYFLVCPLFFLIMKYTIENSFYEIKCVVNSIANIQEKVFLIKTDNDNYANVKNDILSIITQIVGYKPISKKRYDMLNRFKPSFENYLRRYYKLRYNKDLESYIFTIIIPIDK